MAVILFSSLVSSIAQSMITISGDSVVDCFTGDSVRLRAAVGQGAESCVVEWEPAAYVAGAGGDSATFAGFPAGDNAVVATLRSEPGGAVIAGDTVVLNASHHDSIDLYCAGAAGGRPAYWSNQSLITSLDSETDGVFEKVICNGGDFYLVGGTRSAYPRYWKNGIEQRLSCDSGGTILDLAVDTSGVVVCVGYCRGYDSTTGLTVGRAAVWNGGEMSILNNTYSRALGVALADGDVHIAGERNYTELMYWRNGDEYLLCQGSADHRFDCVNEKVGMFATKNGIYIGGNAQYSPEDYGLGYGFWWHNEKTNYLIWDTSQTDPFRVPFSTARLWSFFANDDGFCALAVSNLNPYDKYIFFDGVPRRWEDTSSEFSIPTALTVHRGHLFVAGVYLRGGEWQGGAYYGGASYPCYWRNGKRYELANPPDSGSVRINSICVADRKPSSIAQRPARQLQGVENRGLLRTQKKTAEDARLAFSLSEDGKVWLDVFDIRGRLVKTSFLGMFRKGAHTVSAPRRGVAYGLLCYRIRFE